MLILYPPTSVGLGFRQCNTDKTPALIYQVYNVTNDETVIYIYILDYKFFSKTADFKTSLIFRNTYVNLKT